MIKWKTLSKYLNLFNVTYSRDNLPKTKFNAIIKDGAYVINLDEYSDIETHCIALLCI